MKEIYNIFSNKPERTEKPKTNILIDIHEKNSLVPAHLSTLKSKYSFESLKIGDYLINETIIERKTFNDFLSSLVSKRLFEQITNLKEYQKYFLLIEGFDFNYINKSIHENSIKGTILSISTQYKVPIIFSKDEKDTASFLSILANKKEKENQLIRINKKAKSLEEQKRFILEGFPGIGPVISEKLIKNYKNLKEIFNLSKEELSKIKGFDNNKIERFKQILES